MTTTTRPTSPSATTSTISIRTRSASITAYVEPAVLAAAPGESFQFERHGYFVADLKDHAPGRPVFNRTVTLRDSRDRRAGP